MKRRGFLGLLAAAAAAPVAALAGKAAPAADIDVLTAAKIHRARRIFAHPALGAGYVENEIQQRYIDMMTNPPLILDPHREAVAQYFAKQHDQLILRTLGGVQS